jgi:hypothetical protein
MRIGAPDGGALQTGAHGQRTMQAALNKLTEQNFAVVAGALNACMAAGQLTDMEVCRAILTKSVREDCYAHLYARLLTEIHSRDVARAEAQRFCQDFCAAGERAPALPAADREYDAFCDAAKAKRQLLGKNRTVLALMRHELAPPQQDPTTYAHFIAAQLEAECAAPVFDDTHAEVLLEFIADFAKAFPLHARACGKQLAAMYEGRVAPVCNAKCRFKMLDVLERCGVRTRERHHAPHPHRATAPTAPTAPILPNQGFSTSRDGLAASNSNSNSNNNSNSRGWKMGQPSKTFRR